MRRTDSIQERAPFERRVPWREIGDVRIVCDRVAGAGTVDIAGHRDLGGIELLADYNRGSRVKLRAVSRTGNKTGIGRKK